MYLVYLGESGNTGNSINDPNQPHHVHVGLLVHEGQATSMSGEFNALCRRHFGSPPGEPGTPSALRPADVYQGRGPFTGWSPGRRHQLIQDCLAIMIRRETPLIAAYVEKSQFARARTDGGVAHTLWQTPSELIISRFLFALNMFMDELNTSGLNHEQVMQASWPVNDFALMVAANRKSVEPRFMTDYLRSEQGRDSSAVLENLCYVGREQSVGTQLANICAYFARRWLQSPSESHPYFEALRDGKVIQVIYPVQL